MKLMVILMSCLFFLLEKETSAAYFDDGTLKNEPDNTADIPVSGTQECEPNQEKLLSFMERIELNADTLSKMEQKLDRLESKVAIISKNTETGFAIANSMKNLDRKMARLQLDSAKMLLANDRTPAKLTMKDDGTEDVSRFNAFNNMEDMLMDMATKVEALYEKSLTEDESIFDSPNEIRHLNRGCRMLAGPYRKLVNSIEYLQNIVKEMSSSDEMALTTGKSGQLRNSVVRDIQDNLAMIYDEIQTLRRKNEKNINENERILRRIDKKLDSELEDDDEDDEKLKRSLKKYMIEQRRILEKNLRKILKDDDDDSDDDSDDDDDNKRRTKSKKKGKSKDDDSDDDSDDDDDDDDDDDVVCDDSDENGSKSCEKEKKSSRRKKKPSKKDDDTDDDDDDDDDDDNDDDDVVCDDSDENGSKSCERENKKAYSRGGKKKPRRGYADLDDDDDDSDDVDKPKRKSGKRTKIRKHVKDIEPMELNDANDRLAADESVKTDNFLSYFGIRPSDVKPNPEDAPKQI